MALYSPAGKLFGKVKMASRLSRKDIEGFIGKKEINKVGISIVGNVSKAAMKWLEKSFDLTILNHETPLPISNKYHTPKTLGKDRLAAAIGASFLYPKQNCLILDAGTCLTYDFLDEKGVYHGGGISPGLNMRFKAMNKFTAALPLETVGSQRSFIGKNTTQSLRVGAQWGFIYEIDGFIEAYSKKFSGLTVISTGGDAKYLAKKVKTKIFVHPNLVLVGLNSMLNQDA